MLYEGYIAADISETETKLAERRAAENFRFRNLRSKESQALIAVVTSLLALFIR